jgi:hypothetical protein
VPLDLGHHPARCLPALRLIAEVGVVPPDLAMTLGSMSRTIVLGGWWP